MKRWWLVCWAVVSPLFLTVCSSVDTKKDLSDDFYAEAQSKKVVQEAVPEFVNQALLLNNSTSGVTNKRKASRFDVTVKEMPAKTFFLSLVGSAGVNVVPHPEVDGFISLQLQDVTVEDVLKITREIFGYEYRLENNIYTIYPKKLRTEIFSINYIDVKRVGVSDTSVSIGEITSGGSQTNGGGSSGGNSSKDSNILGILADDDLNDSVQGIAPGSRVQTINKTDFWQMVEATLISIVGAGSEGRKVMVNPQAGLAIVTAMPTEINKVREFLVSSELSARRQVVLETRILEVSLNKGFEAGVNWNAISGQLAAGKNLADGFLLNGDSASTSPFRNVQVTHFFNSEDGNTPPTMYQYGVSEDTGTTVAGLLQVKDITKLLSLLETQGKVQVLSSPRVSTVNNQKAVIRVGKDAFFVTGLSNDTTSSAGATTTSPEVELASFFSGISLDVTPQISANGDVLLHIHPIISDVSDQQKEIVVGDSKISLPLALREIRESDSIVRAKNGQVVVLGGLMQESVRHVDGKHPGLGDIPGVNLLFKSKSQATRKTELVILLRPVVVDEETWGQQIDQFGEFSQSIGDYP